MSLLKDLIVEADPPLAFMSRPGRPATAHGQLGNELFLALITVKPGVYVSFAKPDDDISLNKVRSALRQRVMSHMPGYTVALYVTRDQSRMAAGIIPRVGAHS